MVLVVDGIFYNLLVDNWLNILIIYLVSSVAVYYAATMLELKDNKPHKAFAVIFVGFAFGLIRDFFFDSNFIFSWIFVLGIYLYSIKAIYEESWTNAVLLSILSIVVAFLIGYFVTPFLFSIF